MTQESKTCNKSSGLTSSCSSPSNVRVRSFGLRWAALGCVELLCSPRQDSRAAPQKSPRAILPAFERWCVSFCSVKGLLVHLLWLSPCERTPPSLARPTTREFALTAAHGRSVASRGAHAPLACGARAF